MKSYNYKIYFAFLLLSIGIFALNAGMVNESLPNVVIKEGLTHVNVYLEEYNPQDSLYLTIGGFIPFGSQEYLNHKIIVNEKGIAKANIKMNIPQLGNIKIGDDHYMILFVPNETVNIILNKKDDSWKAIAFEGYLPQTHSDLNNLKFRDDDSYGISLMQQLQNCKNSAERKSLLRKKLDEQIAEINQMNITDAAKAIIRMGAESEYLYWLYNFGTSFIGRQAYLKLIELPSPEEYGKTIFNADSLLPAPPEGLVGTDEYFEILGSPYAAIFEDFGDYYAPDKVYIDKEGKANYYNRDLFLAKEIIGGKSNYEGSILKDNIENNECREFVDSILIQQMEHARELSLRENVYCHTLDNVAPDKILDFILDKYKDKNVFIDIWATWCQPCLLGHRDMEPYKEELEDAKLEFVYLTSSSSPLSLWEKMISDIAGDHYYLTSEQMDAILKSYDSTGYPTYAIYDKERNLRQKITGYIGLAKMKAIIEESLK